VKQTARDNLALQGELRGSTRVVAMRPKPG
jgi:hypothetical protein